MVKEQKVMILIVQTFLIKIVFGMEVELCMKIQD